VENKTTTDILNGVIEGFERDDKALAEKWRSWWGADFLTKWKDKMDQRRSDLSKNGSVPNLKDVVKSLKWDGGSPTWVVSKDNENYPTLLVMSPVQRLILEKDLEGDPKGKVEVFPSVDAVRSIFTAFGAKAPTFEKNTDNDGNDIVETKLPGVFLGVQSTGENVYTLSVAFSSDALEKMITLPTETK
jgi:hypothetical protein